MTNLKTLLVSAAAGVATLSAAAAANAVSLVPTTTYQTYASTAASTPILFSYSFTAPGAVIFYQELVGSFVVASEESPVLMGSGSYDTKLKLNSGVTVGYVAGAVPEPAAWGMMLVGFGAVGAVARRRKSALVAA